MSGHSKWSKIKRAKGAQDKKRGKLFTRAIHEITVAVREGGGGDAEYNARLRIAIEKAKAVNMPNDNIERAIKRATGEIKGEEEFELTYEGYGAGGTAVFVEALTNNKNRTVSDVRNAFTKCGGTLGENGCVAWMFSKKGILAVKKEGVDEEELMEAALEAGAHDISDEGDVWEIECDPAEFVQVKEALGEKYSFEMDEIMMVPSTRNKLSGKEAEQMMRLLETLEDIDDVLNVSANCDFDEE